MAGCKKLKNIAHGLLGTFLSRNNDIGGYWGIGVLKQYAIRHDLAEIIFDLHARAPVWTADSPIQSIERRYQKWLFDTFDRIGMDRNNKQPLAYPVVHQYDVRRALTQKFPYSIIFTVEEQSIFVIAVFHSSRDPMIWKGRID